MRKKKIKIKRSESRRARIRKWQEEMNEGGGRVEKREEPAVTKGGRDQP